MERNSKAKLLGGVRQREEKTALDVGGSAQDSTEQKVDEGGLETKRAMKTVVCSYMDRNSEAKILGSV